ncbi:integrase [Agrobacterium sp. MS2]|nr:integrase [Agrobacterium sp. MS2]
MPQVLIPVLVTGLQSTRVCASESLFRSKDLGWVDSWDKHRLEGC